MITSENYDRMMIGDVLMDRQLGCYWVVESQSENEGYVLRNASSHGDWKNAVKLSADPDTCQMAFRIVDGKHSEDDAAIEKLWDELTDIPMDPETEKMDTDWRFWKKGTDREDIWHWFDSHHSKGVAYLLYDL